MTKRQFTDATGRTWDVSLDALAAIRIDDSDFSALTDRRFSFLDPGKDDLLHVLTRTRLLLAVIWAIVQPQIEPGTKETDFLRSLNGDAIDAAREALIEACADFFPDVRSVLSTYLQTLRDAKQQYQAQMTAMAPEIQAALAKDVETGLAEVRQKLAHLKTRGDSPETT